MHERPEVGSFEYFKYLGLTDEEARGMVKNWLYQAPQDPVERAKVVRAGVEWERQMRLLNTDLHDGRITPEEYQKRAEELSG